MECTQRLEFTQELYESRTEKTSPEQIGFIGICGTKHPVKHGPNKIGRDPQTCNIVLQLNSISRQHAVINVLNKTDFMLMDLDSANKTKLMNKTLQPYIPHPLKNGDMVQFGDVFGVFRVLEEDTDLPMTQALDIPETPITYRHISRINNVPITTIPESPDVSDKDDSFIAPSQPKGSRPFRNSNTNYIKQSAKIISIQPVGLNINEMETQPQLEVKHNENADSIHTADTQLPILNSSPSIHNISTQLPVTGDDNLPEVCKINNQYEMQFNLFTTNGNDNNIFEAETQQYTPEKEQIFPIRLNSELKKLSTTDKETYRDIHDAATQHIEEKEIIPVVPNVKSTNVLENKPNNSQTNLSEEEIIFEEINDDLFEDNFESQSLLPEFLDNGKKKVTVTLESDKKYPKVLISNQKRNGPLKSDSSTDIEDIEIIPTQQLPEPPLDEDVTDCEDELNESETTKVKFEDMLTQIIDENDPDITSNNKQNIEDMATQIIEDNESSNRCGNKINVKENPIEILNAEESKNKNNGINYEDLPTQILYDDIPLNKDISNENLIISDNPNGISPFKIPLQSPIKIKRKDISVVNPLKERVLNNSSKINGFNITDADNYYTATQEILDDLCTQAQHSLEIAKPKPDNAINNNDLKTKSNDNDFVPCSVEEYQTDDKLPGLDNLSPKKKNITSENSIFNNDLNIISPSNLSSQQIREVIGVDVAKFKKISSDSSDVDVTPKKKPFRFLDIDLPNSQEIKTSVTLIKPKDTFIGSSSDSETEIDFEEQYTPILLRKKKRSKVDSKQNAKQNLSNKLNIDGLPTRVLSRIRKPTAKIQNTDPQIKNILKPKFLTEQDDNINEDIINENILRLQSENVKMKNNKKYELNSESKNNINNRSTNNIRSSNKSKDIMKSESKKTCIEKNRDGQQKNVDNPSTSREKNKASSSEKKVNGLVIDSNNEKSKRSTRSSKKKEESENKVSVKVKEENVKIDRTESKKRNEIEKSSRKQVHKIVDKMQSLPDGEKEVRRSMRQKRNKKEDSIIKVKITKPNKRSRSVQHEKSTVYNVSSESDRDVTMSLKRSAMDTSRAPSPKRKRSAGNISLRATPARILKTQYVLFTAFPCEEVKLKLENLGAVVVTDVAACTVLLTLSIRRTFKLLCAVGLGKPIVGADWVQACADTKRIVDPWLHLIKDEAAEARFKFNLERTLRSKRNFLKGYNISSTPNVMPNASEMKSIVECSGGSWKEGGSNWMCVSCSADKSLWPSLKQRGATIVSTEFILGGVLRQKLDVTNSKLC
ncbi:uncharacterized protein PF3D7_1120600-like [Galleria mellonella]|uniref:Mediator of DNA damage checkpoint protein 1 n=1 Tax=Galleria mellonella TaxID=7137 RepID=A0ABM3MBE1_GALME|nr:uncharacterized protein PF3D7_1120600-like [Galleria mellonella]